MTSATDFARRSAGTVPTGFAGSLSYRLSDRFRPAMWYAGIIPGIVFNRFVGDGNFAIRARRG